MCACVSLRPPFEVLATVQRKPSPRERERQTFLSLIGQEVRSQTSTTNPCLRDVCEGVCVAVNDTFALHTAEFRVCQKWCTTAQFTCLYLRFSRNNKKPALAIVFFMPFNFGVNALNRIQGNLDTV